MSDQVINDNEGPQFEPSPLPGSHGQAALILVESLIHGLIERSVLSVEDAIDIVDTALSIGSEIGAEQNDPAGHKSVIVAQLEAIASSLEIYG